MHTVGLYSAIAPTRLVHNMSAIMFRFANSERQYLHQLAADIKKRCGDNITLKDFVQCIPSGGIADPPILQSLHAAMSFVGHSHHILKATRAKHDFAWLDTRFSHTPLTKKDSVQANVYRALAPVVSSQQHERMIAHKLEVTFGASFWNNVVLVHNWWDVLSESVNN